MPLKKFRSLEEAGEDLMTDPESASPARLRAFFVYTQMLRKHAARWPFFKGVRRYRALEEAFADRQELSSQP